MAKRTKPVECPHCGRLGIKEEMPTTTVYWHDEPGQPKRVFGCAKGIGKVQQHEAR